jgi:hypothetical protein
MYYQIMITYYGGRQGVDIIDKLQMQQDGRNELTSWWKPWLVNVVRRRCIIEILHLLIVDQIRFASFGNERRI